MNSEVIKQFYSNLRFPGAYRIDDIKFYDQEGIHNVYLKQIDNFLMDGQEVLDVGCGTGMVSNLFAYRYRSNFTGVDFSDSIDYASEFAVRNNICNVNWVKQDFLQYEITQQFDTIICCGVLHHIPNYQQALDKMKSALAPGGHLLLAVYNPYGKLLKKFVNIKYHNSILYQDQELNPYELSFSRQDVLTMCNDLNFVAVQPSWRNHLVDLQALFNSENGGLAIYVFEKPQP
jgi:2-polyprenyl-3-methyl-5-hydroxy-6-metoxy-1,4-benzoquinol methylase